MERHDYLFLAIAILAFALSIFNIMDGINRLRNRMEVKIKPTCIEVNGTRHVNRSDCLPTGYQPEVVLLDKRSSYLTTKQYVDVKAKVMLEQLINDAEKDGMCLVVVSGYRSYEDQEDLYNKIDDKNKVAIAGHSEHQTGLAVDFTGCPIDKKGNRDDTVERLELKNDFESLPEYKWLLQNGSRYGFEQSYRADNTNETGYPVESWHWKLITQ